MKQRISESMRVPGDCFYLTLNSRLLDEDALFVESGISRDTQIFCMRQIAGWSDFWRVGLLVLQKRRLLGFQALLFPVWSAKTKHSRWFWVFRPMDTRGTFGKQQHMGRKPTPQTMGDSSMRGPVFGRAPYVVSQESLVSSRTMLKKRH